MKLGKTTNGYQGRTRPRYLPIRRQDAYYQDTGRSGQYHLDLARNHLHCLKYSQAIEEYINARNQSMRKGKVNICLTAWLERAELLCRLDRPHEAGAAFSALAAYAEDNGLKNAVMHFRWEAARQFAAASDPEMTEDAREEYHKLLPCLRRCSPRDHALAKAEYDWLSARKNGLS